jgi:hypothetical protein
MPRERGRSKRQGRLFRSRSFHDPFIRETARRMNRIADMAASFDFEALRFMYELRLAILADTREPTRPA